jgi:hypothetical protein
MVSTALDTQPATQALSTFGQQIPPVVIPASVKFDADSLKGVAGDSITERRKMADLYQVDMKANLNTDEATDRLEDLRRQRTDLQKPILMTTQADITSAVTNLGRVVEQQKLVAPIVSSAILIDNSQALTAIGQVLERWQALQQSMSNTPAPAPANPGSSGAPFGVSSPSTADQMRARGVNV